MDWIRPILLSSIKHLNPESVTDDNATRVLFLTAIFFGRRLRFIIEDGGFLLLSSNRDEKKVMKAYSEIKKSFNWVNDETPKNISYLQKVFIEKDKTDSPFVLWDFSQELKKDDSLQKSRDELKKWLTKQNIVELDAKITEFIEVFKESINSLYTAWSD